MRHMARHSLLLITIAAVMLLACGGTVLAQPGQEDSGQSTESTSSNEGLALQGKQKLQVADPKAGQKGPLSEAQKLAMRQGYLVPDRATYEKKKARANRKAEKSSNAKQQSSAESASGESTSGKSDVTDLLRSESGVGKSTPAKRSSSSARKHKKRAITTPESTSSSVGTKKPVPVTTSEGAFDPNAAPSDSTSAAGLDRYIELVNQKYRIYSPITNTTPIVEGTLNELASSAGSVFDPQVMWDPDTNRFYYAADLIFSSTDNRTAFGFSKTATPSSAADFCHYSISYGSRFEDYPKLGDTRNFLLIGANAFDVADNFLGADLSFVSKPPSGTITTCPAFGSFTTGVFQNIGVGGANTVTPVPAQQIDGSTTGYVVARATSLTANQLRMFTVTESGGTISTPTGTSLTVPSYTVPPNAQQPGTTNRLDTLDARPTQAVSAIDPSRGGKVALWTQHTIRGGSPDPINNPTSSSVRWYEIDPSVSSVLQSEQIYAQGVNLYLFNVAVSPDRVVNGADKRFRDTMFLGMNYSSTSLNPGILLANKIGSNVVSSTLAI